MTIRNDSRAYGFLAGALVLLVALLANVSCAHYPDPQRESADVSRTLKQQAEASVAIYTECGSGSGVLVNGNTVITAFHVVNCADWPETAVARLITVRTSDKRSSTAVLKVNDGGRDLASLTLNEPFEGVTPIAVRMAVDNEPICAATSVPERAFRCGFVKGFDGPRLFGDVLVRSMNIWYGNSGSGVYGRDGALVGIAVRLNWCTIGDAYLFMLTDERVVTCGGRVSSLTDSAVYQ
jgi:hypothetical protein